MKKALYGIPPAGQLWYTDITTKLIKDGYTQLKTDRCVFMKSTPAGKSIICLHVDDLLHAFSDKSFDDHLKEILIDAYKEINHTCSDRLDYLGMLIEFNRKNSSARISLPGYVNDMLKGLNIQGTATTPSTINLFKENNNKERCDQKQYASMVMKLMYLGKRTRPDILLPVTYLATRITQCTMDDRDKLMRVFKYINKTRDYYLYLSPTSLEPYCMADASYACHPDARSHTGVIVTLGQSAANQGCTLLAKSCKQKLVSRSTTEAELIALHEALPHLIWLRSLLTELGYPPTSPSILYQDNQSTIRICNKGHGYKSKTKHMDVRYYFVKDKIEDKTVTVMYLPTADMTADYLTKPLGGNIHDVHLNHLLGPQNKHKNE